MFFGKAKTFFVLDLTPNGPPNCPWLIWVHFWGPWPISGPLEGSETKIYISEAHPWSYFDLIWPPCQPSKFFWSKMACRGVSRIFLHVLCSTRTSGGQFRPSEVRFTAIFAVSGDLFIRQKHTFCKKGHFPQRIWLKICVWTPKHLPDLNPRAGKWAIPGPKKTFRRGVFSYVSRGYTWKMKHYFQCRLRKLRCKNKENDHNHPQPPPPHVGFL